MSAHPLKEMPDGIVIRWSKNDPETVEFHLPEALSLEEVADLLSGALKIVTAMRDQGH